MTLLRNVPQWDTKPASPPEEEPPRPHMSTLILQHQSAWLCGPLPGAGTGEGASLQHPPALGTQSQNIQRTKGESHGAEAGINLKCKLPLALL